MKLLFDQNISFRILKLLIDMYPESQQSRRLSLDDKTDLSIWSYAKKHNFTIVTFDSDYFDIANLKGHPPKIIWLRTTNQTTSNIVRLFEDKKELIIDFIQNPEHNEWACLELK